MQTSDERRIDNYAPLLNGRERDYVLQAIESGWVSYGGRYVKEFETSLAQTFGCADAVTVASGTCALQLAFELAGERDTEILIPALTFAAPASAAVRAGMHPVFIDLNPKTWQLDDELLAAFLEERCVRRDGRVVNTASGRPVSTICLVHLWGDLARLDRIHALARQWNLVVIHDAAQCLGACYKGMPLGASVPDDQGSDHLHNQLQRQQDHHDRCRRRTDRKIGIALSKGAPYFIHGQGRYDVILS